MIEFFKRKGKDRPEEDDLDATGPIPRVVELRPSYADSVSEGPDRLLGFGYGDGEDYWCNDAKDARAFEAALRELQKARSLGRIGIAGALALAGFVAGASIFIGTTGTKYIPGLKPDKLPAVEGALPVEDTAPSESFGIDTLPTSAPSSTELTAPQRPEITPTILSTSSESLTVAPTSDSVEQTSEQPVSETEEPTTSESSTSESPSSTTTPEPSSSSSETPPIPGPPAE